MSGYRPNVCAVITDETRTHVLVFRRADAALGDRRWQFPQGGLEPGETVREGLLRELAEEIGTNDVEVLAEAPEPVRYDFPPEVLRRLRDRNKAGYRGQEQWWFLVRLRQGVAAIHFDHEPAEFDAFRWVLPREVPALMVDFKVGAYTQGLRALGMLPDAPGPA